MRSDFFLYRECWVHYCTFGSVERGYSAKADISALKVYPASYIPIRLEKMYAMVEEAESAIIDFCKYFIEENFIKEVTKKQ